MRSNALALALALAACKGDKPTMILDAALVQDRLDLVGAELPGCDVTGPSAARVPVFAGTPSTGVCGGDVQVDFTHESGVTDYTMVFQSFCASSADGDVIVEGTVRATEIGTPSDSGPIISALELSTDGPVEVTTDGKTFALEIIGARTDYGKPATWAPDEPDAANPDTTTVERASITWSDGSVDYLEDGRWERVGGLEAQVEVFEGRLGREGEDFAVVRTVVGEPLAIDLLGLTAEGGALEVLGKKDTRVVIRPDPDTVGAVIVELDGEPFPDALNCAAGREPLVQAGAALFLALPFY